MVSLHIRHILQLMQILAVCTVCQCHWTSGGICDLCLNQPFIVFNDKRVTEGVLWTVQGMSTRAECASRCHLFEKIKSFGFSPATGECVAYTVPLSAPVDVTYTSQSGFNMYSTCAPVDGGFTDWSFWSASCPNTCGTAPSVNRERTRTCTNPSPANGGADCSGRLTETEDLSCTLGNCPIDGGFTNWGSWSGSCPNTCGYAASVSRQRTRTCTNPSPAYGGAECSGTTTDTGTLSCSLASCPSSSTPNFGSCSSNSDCTSPSNTVCEQNMCVCDISYQYRSGSCIQGCSTYSSAFTLFHNKVLNGYNDKIVSSVATPDACANLCLSESSFLCVTADYEHSVNKCYMSKTTWFGAPNGQSSSSTYHQLIRNCAS